MFNRLEQTCQTNVSNERIEQTHRTNASNEHIERTHQTNASNELHRPVYLVKLQHIREDQLWQID